MEIIYLVTHADHGMRAVDVLTSRAGLSRLQTKRIRLYGELLNNDRHWRMIDAVSAGDRLVARTAEDHDARPPLRRPESIGFIFEDDWLAVLNKPAGLVVHPTFKHEKGTLTDLLSDFSLHPVSRLDRDTSGLVMIAKNGHAHYVLSQNRMKKIYLAVVHGQMPSQSGSIDAPIARAPDSLIRRLVADPGLPASTNYTVMTYNFVHDLSVVRFELVTGRTHQIRVHSQHVGCPLVGDTLYGIEPDRWTSIDQQMGRQALHAIELIFNHPRTGETIRLQAPLPFDFRQLIKTLI